MDWWTHFLNMLHSEFSDIKDLTELFRMTIRLLLAAILGGLLGLERESSGKNAGIRTHMLVAMGSAFFHDGAVVIGRGRGQYQPYHARRDYRHWLFGRRQHHEGRQGK